MSAVKELVKAGAKATKSFVPEFFAKVDLQKIPVDQMSRFKALEKEGISGNVEAVLPEMNSIVQNAKRGADDKFRQTKKAEAVTGNQTYQQFNLDLDKLQTQLDNLPENQFIGDQRTITRKSGEQINVLAKPRTEAKKVQSLISQVNKKLGKNRPPWFNPNTDSTWVFESKGGGWRAIDVLKKRIRNNRRLNLSKGKYISLEEFVAELGPELGTKAFHLNESKMEKLYRWVSKEGAHLDHIYPVSGSEGGYLVHTNMLLQLAENNIRKGDAILPAPLLKEMGVPRTKVEAIRSVLGPKAMPNKQKRKLIIETLGLVNK